MIQFWGGAFGLKRRAKLGYVVWDYVFRYVFDKFTVYQRRQNRRLKELLAHTRKCRSLGRFDLHYPKNLLVRVWGLGFGV